jgi:hypothetical protein
MKTLGPRYGLESWGDDWWMAFADDGDYVLYDEAAAALAERDARIAELERYAAGADSALTDVAARCNAALARAEAAERASRKLQRNLDSAIERADVHEKNAKHFESEAASLRAEVERLQGMLKHAGKCEMQNLEGWLGVEARLAAATELLGRWLVHDMLTADPENLRRQTRAFLANSTAAPTRAAGACPACDGSGAFGCLVCGWS